MPVPLSNARTTFFESEGRRFRRFTIEDQNTGCASRQISSSDARLTTLRVQFVNAAETRTRWHGIIEFAKRCATLSSEFDHPKT